MIRIATVVCLLTAIASAQIPGFPGLPFPCGPLTVKRQWQTPVSLNAGLLPNSQPDAAASANGEAIAVWLGRDPLGRVILYARRYTPPVFLPGTGTWSPPVVLDYSLWGLSNPRVAIDDRGNALAVWQRPSVNGLEIGASSYNRSLNRWSVLSTISNGYIPSGASPPNLVMNGSGDGAAVWEQEAALGLQIFASRFSGSTSAWTSAVQVSRVIPNDAGRLPKAVMDSAGRAIVAWHQGSVPVVYAARFTPSTSWEAPVPVSSNNVSLPASNPESAWFGDLTLNQAGIGFVGWTLGKTPQFASVVVRRLNTALPIDANPVTNPAVIMSGSTPEFASSIRLAVDDAGSLGAVFLGKEFGTSARSVFARERGVGGALTPASGPMLLETRSVDSSELSFGMDAAGNGVATWVQPDGAVPSLFANHLAHSPATLTCSEQWTWSAQMPAETSSEPVSRARSTVQRSGAALAVWTSGGSPTPGKVFAGFYQ